MLMNTFLATITGAGPANPLWAGPGERSGDWMALGFEARLGRGFEASGGRGADRLGIVGQHEV